MDTNGQTFGFVRAFLRRRSFAAATAVSLLAAIYWGLIASDRYVSEAHVIVQNTDIAASQAGELSTLLGDLGSQSGGDQLLLRDHLLSVDMLNKLDERLNLRAHFSDSQRDLVSRMWSADTEQEWFHRHFLSRVAVERDERSGVLIIQAQAYDPETAHAISSLLVEEGERFMNAMAHRLAREQVAFLEQQVEEMSKRAIDARQAMLKYQNEKGLVSPRGTAENLAGIVNSLESKRTELQARRSAMLGYLMPGSADLVDLDLQIAAVEKQIVQEKRRLASPDGPALNETVEEFQRLEQAAVFAEDVYKTALVALEQGRIEAIRTLKKVSILQAPTRPQYPLEPQRLYNMVVFTLVALLLAGVFRLLGTIIRDHKD